MKTITGTLKTHLAQSVTTTATCWLITRTDGAAYAFTDHDADLTVSGVTYKASSGYSRSAMKSDSTLAVDNLSVTGILNSSLISEADLEAGKFDYASVQIFLVNWSDLTQGILRMHSGTFGETVFTPTGIFQTELRGLTQALVQDVTDKFSKTCRANLGDSNCKVPVKPAAWAATTAAKAGAGYQYNTTYVSDPSPTDDAHALALYKCTTAGTTGTTAPAFNPTLGATTTETTGVVWTSVQPLRGVATVVGTPATRNSFVTSSITLPATALGTRGVVSFSGQSAYGLAFVLSVGTQTVTLAIPTNYNASDSTNWLAQAVNAAHTAGTIAATASVSFTTSGIDSTIITKVNSSDSGNIQVNNDLTGVVSISNFSDAGTTGDPYLAGGLVTWVTGANAGLSMEIKSYTPATGTVELFLNMPFAIAAGDKFYWQPGCDNTRPTCAYQWNNILNFRGHPDLPGMDALMKYPVL